MSDPMADDGAFWCYMNPKEAAEKIDRLVKALTPFGYYFDLNDCDDRDDDDALEIPIRDLRAARDLLRGLAVSADHQRSET